ncbi:MAG TPA: DUF3108 domain-containing protein [Desulfatiglandales bacterium]|nr:DUF3108 domain-containing protein [Desulfatiglandales bacterium]
MKDIRLLAPDNYLKKFKVKPLYIFLVIAFIIIFSFPQNGKGAQKAVPFYPGERLTFQVKWGFIPAGEAVLEVLPIEIINGIESYHFVMTAKTYPLIDVFYKVRDRIDSYANREMTHSILYKKQNKGKTKRDIIVNFDWEKQEAQYSNFGKKREPISIADGSFDPLSIFYAFRLQDLKEKIELENSVTDGKKSIIGKARVVKKEKIEVPGGIFDTYLVEPDLKDIGGVFRKSKNAKLEVWVTSDARHIPVQIKSKVIVGSFVVELISGVND